MSRVRSWASARADDAAVLLALGVVLLLSPAPELFADRLAAVGIGLGLADFVGLLALTVGLLLGVVAGAARLLAAVGRHR